MISNGIQGEYIARIFEEVKGRPLYVVGQTFGFGEARAPGASATEAIDPSHVAVRPGGRAMAAHDPDYR
jgi:hypothetical protein